MSARIHYISGYHHKLLGAVTFDLSEYGLRPVGSVTGNSFVRISAEGMLHISDLYSWDGSSGVQDTRSSMRASLVHDALYQLMRLGVLPPTARSAADHVYWRLCREDGMGRVRAWIRRVGLWLFGEPASRLGRVKPVQTAP